MDLGVKGLNKVKEGVKEVSRDHQKEGHDQSPAENITLQEEVPGDRAFIEKIEELNSKDEGKGKSSDTTVLTHEVARKSQTSSYHLMTKTRMRSRRRSQSMSSNKSGSPRRSLTLRKLLSERSPGRWAARWRRRQEGKTRCSPKILSTTPL